MKHHPRNVERAGWAKNALKVFTKETYGGDVPDTMHPGDRETAIQDLVTDLMHYLNQHPFKNNMQPEEVVARAIRMYFEELHEPEI